MARIRLFFDPRPALRNPQSSKNALTAPSAKAMAWLMANGSPFFNGPSRKSKFRQRRPEEERQPPERPVFPSPPEPAASEEKASLDPEDVPGTAARPFRPPPRGWYVNVPPYRDRWLMPLALIFLTLGGVAGYYIGVSKVGREAPPATEKSTHPVEGTPPSKKPATLSAEEQSELDAAYQAARAGRYVESRQLFESFNRRHPQWPRLAIEVARMEIYAHDTLNAKAILTGPAGEHPEAEAEAFFLLGILNLEVHDFSHAEDNFAAAVAIDPTRPDYYYFWGDCLRQEGKALEAGNRFRSALYRNQLETSEDLLQLKVWLCDLTTDQANTNGTSAAIDAALASPHPRTAALMAAAARFLGAGRIPEAITLITRARAALDPTVFDIEMADPAFVQESLRPGMAAFYATPLAQPAAATPADSPAATP